MTAPVDIAVIGAGAAGLFAAIWAGRTARLEGNADLRVVALDGARRLGAKILVAGGGRCNVTHHAVRERDYAGSTAPAIRNVLRAFPVERTMEFFAELGVELKREETGKLFPVTDRAQTVLDALLAAAAQAHVELRHPTRVQRVGNNGDLFVVEGEWGVLHARRLILCTGGKALPKSGSDGAGYAFARAFGHTITEPVLPALVPLVLAPGHWLTNLSGLTLPAEFTVHASAASASGSSRAIPPARSRGSALCTHFGLSGPAVLDISRHLLMARQHDPGAQMSVNWLPGFTPQTWDQALLEARGRTMLALLREHLPERMARALCQEAGIDGAAAPRQLSRAGRLGLVTLATTCPLPVTGDRGFTFAETTAGGVPLSELRLDTMESRLTPGVHLAGELCDVDGRIGGFNFQWAWASGYLAGCAAARQVARAS